MVYILGLVDYHKGLLLQERLLTLRKYGSISDVLLLLQHPSVLTIGRSGFDKNIIVSKETLIEEGISVFYTNRGGDVTYHGPGQIVGYPILHLTENNLTVHQYVWNLEEIVIRTLADFGIVGQRIPEFRGVWVGGEKVSALGVRISGRVTMHGFALNVNTDLKYFNYIVPCGIMGRSVTSISKLLGHEVKIKEIQEIVLRHFSEVFAYTLEYGENFDKWLASLSPSGSEEELLIQPH